ncbi:MAG: extracellular solute-binding protein, partial [Flexilinea sp.]|nr:extracellular solute-binding protein [Flexilinea sp.]
MKKSVVFLVVVMLLAAVLSAAAENVTLNVVTSYGGDDGNRANFEAAVAEYEAQTGNKVNDGSATSNEEWKARVLTDFETGSEPDVLFFFTNADAEPFVSAGKVVSIDEIRAEYPDYATNMKDSMLAVASDGKNYAVPSYGYWENMFVNKSVLDACGIEVPGPDYTWDQFLADCQTILDNGYTPIACSLVEVPHYWFEFVVMNNGTLANQLDVPASMDDAAAAKWVAGLNDLKDLYERGFFPKNTLTATDAETVAMFGEGEAAFLIDGSWKVGYFTGNHEDTLED